MSEGVSYANDLEAQIPWNILASWVSSGFRNLTNDGGKLFAKEECWNSTHNHYRTLPTQHDNLPLV